MRRLWNRDFLTRRIDRCYLIAAGAKLPQKREIYLELARYYRKVLYSITDPLSGQAVWKVRTPALAFAR